MQKRNEFCKILLLGKFRCGHDECEIAHNKSAFKKIYFLFNLDFHTTEVIDFGSIIKFNDFSFRATSNIDI